MDKSIDVFIGSIAFFALPGIFYFLIELELKFLSVGVNYASDRFDKYSYNMT